MRGTWRTRDRLPTIHVFIPLATPLRKTDFHYDLPPELIAQATIP